MMRNPLAPETQVLITAQGSYGEWLTPGQDPVIAACVGCLLTDAHASGAGHPRGSATTDLGSTLWRAAQSALAWRRDAPSLARDALEPLRSAGLIGTVQASVAPDGGLRVEVTRPTGQRVVVAISRDAIVSQ